MRIKEIHEILQKNKNGKVTQNDIACAIGTSRANVSKLFAKNSFINDEKIEKIEKYFDVKIRVIPEILQIDYFPDEIAAVKKGELIFSDKSVKTMIPQTFLNVEKDSKYIMCNSKDNSMAPYIMSGDFVIIALKRETKIFNNKVHAFIYNDEFYIRRLSKNINQIIVKSDNKDFPTQYIEKGEMKNLHILGQIVYIGRVDNIK